MNVLQLTTIQFPRISNSTLTQFNNFNSIPTLFTSIIKLYSTRNTSKYLVKVGETRPAKSTDLVTQIRELEAEGDDEVHDDNDLVDIDWDKVEDEFSPKGRDEEMNYDKDPEFAEILGTSIDDPAKARSKVSSFMVTFC